MHHALAHVVTQPELFPRNDRLEKRLRANCSAICLEPLRELGPRLLYEGQPLIAVKRRTVPAQLTDATGGYRQVNEAILACSNILVLYATGYSSVRRPVIVALEIHNSRALPSSYEASDERTALPLEK